MPEGDTILRLASKINERLSGARALASIFRHPRLATADLSGRVLIGATSHGKHLFLNWDDDRSLHIHLLMQGQVHLGRRPIAEEWRRRFEIEFEGKTLTGVDIPLLHLIPTSKTGDFIGHLGPDLCGALDLDVAIDRVAADSDAHLGAALLDQRNVAGFGNVYAVEVPFICGIAPMTTVGTIDGLDALLSIGAALIRANARLGPQNTTGRKLSTSDQWILGTTRRDCPICGSILHRRSGSNCPWNRRTIWCEGCQRTDDTVVDIQRAQQLLAMHPARKELDFGGDFGGSDLFVGNRDPVVTSRR
jgi:endonuclease-8